MNNIRKNWTPRALSLLRIMVALLLLQRGLNRLFILPDFAWQASDLSALQLGMAGIEIIGGALLLLGLYTRLMAFICFAEAVLIMALIHQAHGIWPVFGHGPDTLLPGFVCLYLSLAGAGPWSLDRKLRRR